MTTHELSPMIRSIHKPLNALAASWDMVVFAFLIVLFNGHLVGKGDIRAFLFLPDAVVTNGQWWRIMTHPFVHVSVYHLALDAGAFFLLYSGLKNPSVINRLTLVGVCGAFSLAVAWLFSPAISTMGLCGLSGIGHGLMAVSALEMITDKKEARLGYIYFILIVSKSIFEMVNGGVFFSFLHFGRCGTPLVACHGGGVVGGIVAFFLFNKSVAMPDRWWVMKSVL